MINQDAASDSAGGWTNSTDHLLLAVYQGLALVGYLSISAYAGLHRGMERAAANTSLKQRHL